MPSVAVLPWPTNQSNPGVSFGSLRQTVPSRPFRKSVSSSPEENSKKKHQKVVTYLEMKVTKVALKMHSFGPILAILTILIPEYQSKITQEL